MSFEVVKQLAHRKEFDEALKVAGFWLNKHPNDKPMLYMAGRLMIEKGWSGMAKPLCMAAVDGKSFESWNLLGNAQVDLWELDDAYESFRLALQCGPNQASPMMNMAQAELLRGKPWRAVALGNKAAAMDPECPKTKHNLGMALLMLKQWRPGWALYDYGVGLHESRKELVYGEEPRWDGSKGKTVIAYGEQGIGDEVSFASTIPDLIEDCKVIIDCDSRLAGLFKRSFPRADVHGTRYRTGDEWPDKYDIDGRVSFSSLQKFYRNEDQDFPGKPYLVADPERRVQWRALLKDLPGLKVGIAWSGGAPLTGSGLRTIRLETLLPILRQKASFVSLEYRDPTEEIAEFEENHGIKIHEWGRATRTQDYDDTAALVAELDLVISVTTSVIHLAGGLGKECWVMVHKNPMWRYGVEGDMQWYSSVKLYRQKTGWDYVIHRVAEDLSARLSRASPKKATSSTVKTFSKPSKNSGRKKSTSSSTLKEQT